MTDDLGALSAMKYSGRGIIIGITPNDETFIGYSLTGRSPPSQARRLVLDEQNQVVFTEPVTDDATLKKMFKITDDEALAKLKKDIAKGNPALIYYPAMVAVEDFLLASNGVQTDLLYSAARNKPKKIPWDILDSAMSTSQFRYDIKGKEWIDITTYEPDAPNNTPRICACVEDTWVKDDQAALRTIKCVSGEKYVRQIRLLFRLLSSYTSVGHLITTYKGGNETPLLPTDGNPLEVKIGSITAADIAESIYQAQIGGSKPGDNFRVAAAVMLRKNDGTLDTKIINRAERGE